MPEHEDNFLDQVMAMADRLGLTSDEERGQYVHEHMTRAGYKMVPSYVREEEGGENGNKGFFKPKPAGGTGGKKPGGGWFPQ